jgi:quinol monooxygenase YgiN
MKSAFTLLFAACLLPGCDTDRTPGAPPVAAVVVTVDYHAQPGQGDALQAALEPLLAEVRKEPHYIDISVLRSAQDPDRILLVERWADLAYYTGAHNTTPHLAAFKGTAMPLLSAPPTVALWNTVALGPQP